jgi:hypothetical protein
MRWRTDIRNILPGEALARDVSLCTPLGHPWMIGEQHKKEQGTPRIPCNRYAQALIGQNIWRLPETAGA